MRTRVKICGITRVEDGLAAAASGADAIGLNFFEGSTRVVGVDAAARIAGALPPFVTVVGLFVNPGEREVREVLGRLPVDVLQFHGDEEAGFCTRFDVPYVKAARIRERGDAARVAEQHPSARALLLDAHRAGQWGGTGQTFDWSLVPADLGRPVVLAGGLEAGNVADAVRSVRPYAVDVSGGVESAPGVKDAARIEAFINEVNGVEAG